MTIRPVHRLIIILSFAFIPFALFTNGCSSSTQFQPISGVLNSSIDLSSQCPTANKLSTDGTVAMGSLGTTSDSSIVVSSINKLLTLSNFPLLPTSRPVVKMQFSQSALRSLGVISTNTNLNFNTSVNIGVNTNANTKVNENINASASSNVNAKLNSSSASTNSSFSSASQNHAVSQSNAVIPSGFKLAITYDQECLNRKQDSILSEEISLQTKSFENVDAELKNNSRQVTELQLNSQTDLNELTQIVDNNECVISLAESGKVHALLTPTEPGFSSLTHLQAINAPVGWDIFLASQTGITKDVILAVIDTGVDYGHKDLNLNMWKNDSNQFGYDFVNKDIDPMDDHYHGTHVAGLISAIMNNATGAVGIGGNHIKIMAIKTLGSDGSGSITDVANGIYYAVDKGAKIINLSLGTTENSQLKLAMEYALQHGAFVIMAAGNDGVAIDATTAKYPAGYAKDYPGAISVGAIDVSNKARSSFSNYSPTLVEIAAPGSDQDETVNQGIISTVPGNSYAALRGTSQAAPIAAAAAGLAWAILESRGYTVTPALIETILMNGSTVVDSLKTSSKDGKIIDLAALGNYINANYPFTGTISSTTPCR